MSDWLSDIFARSSVADQIMALCTMFPGIKTIALVVDNYRFMTLAKLSAHLGRGEQDAVEVQLVDKRRVYPTLVEASVLSVPSFFFTRGDFSVEGCGDAVRTAPGPVFQPRLQGQACG